MQKTPPNCKVGLGEMFLVVCNQHLGIIAHNVNNLYNTKNTHSLFVCGFVCLSGLLVGNDKEHTRLKLGTEKMRVSFLLGRRMELGPT